jgi:hypothetical protein
MSFCTFSFGHCVEEGKITNINLTVKYNAISDVDSLSSIPGMIAIHRTIIITLYIFMADTKKL